MTESTDVSDFVLAFFPTAYILFNDRKTASLFPEETGTLKKTVLKWMVRCSAPLWLLLGGIAVGGCDPTLAENAGRSRQIVSDPPDVLSDENSLWIREEPTAGFLRYPPEPEVTVDPAKVKR